jgi:hypothetical protein
VALKTSKDLGDRNMSIEERIKILEKKVLKLEGGNLLKVEVKNPYESKSNKEIIISVPQKKENE